jgi:Type III secretion system YscX (type_III_YscX)
MTDIPESFQPGLGLTSIELWDDAAVSKLPQSEVLHPNVEAVPAQLPAILEARTFENWILQALRPKITDPNILVPGRYIQLRQRVLNKLLAMHAAAPDLEREYDLEQAIELLRQESHNHELGQEFRYALLKT